MSLEVRLGQRQEQRLALLPQMLQSIEVLQLATADLLQKVAAELQHNETLEAAARPTAEPPPVAPPRAAESFDDGVTPWRRGGGGDDEDGKSAFLANVPARPPTLGWRAARSSRTSCRRASGRGSPPAPAAQPRRPSPAARSAASPPAWAAASTPRASPLTTHRPARDRASGNE